MKLSASHFPKGSAAISERFGEAFVSACFFRELLDSSSPLARKICHDPDSGSEGGDWTESLLRAESEVLSLFRQEYFRFRISDPEFPESLERVLTSEDPVATPFSDGLLGFDAYATMRSDDDAERFSRFRARVSELLSERRNALLGASGLVDADRKKVDDILSER